MRIFFVSLLSIVGLLSAGPSSAATELEDRAIISALTQDAFLREDFSRLEEVSRGYREEKTRTSSGLWKLTLFYNGIENAIYARAYVKEREAAFRELEGKTTRWAQRYPTSPTAHIAHSIVLIHHAWAFRGAGPASAVKPEAWAPFHKYLALARENLETHKAVAVADPRWYETMLTVARCEDWERDRFDRLLDEALDREPLFYETYFKAFEYYVAKWNDGARAIENLAQEAVRRTSDQEGSSLYARIYWYASQRWLQSLVFTNSLAGRGRG